MSGARPVISSLQNPRVKALVKLRQRRERDRQRLTLIEEPLVIRRALAAGFPLREVWWSPELATAAGAELFALVDALRAAGVEAISVTPPVLDKISYRAHSEGLVVVAPQNRRALADITLGERPLVVVLVAVEKPGNLGAILRTADGAGADAVVVCEEGTDLFNPNVLRASRGALFTLPTVAATTAETRSFLRERGLYCVATVPAGEHRYTDVDLTGPTAVILGAEHAGLTAEWIASCDADVTVPMLGAVDSLNVATTAGIVLYEALRQRHTGR